MARSVEEIQTVELALWDQIIAEEDWLSNLSNKLSELRWIQPKFVGHAQKFRDAQSVLELGGGEGWASCALKRLYPHLHVTSSDISASAASEVGKWERIFESKVDNHFGCKSYSVPLPDHSVDIIFSFQAAHHFRLQPETLKEAARLLTPGGSVMYFHEPSCRKYIHPLAKWRVNHKRPDCPEDLLVLEEMRKAATDHGFKLEVIYSTTTVNRGVIEGLYYKGLSVLTPLCHVLPCTADFIFTKI